MHKIFVLQKTKINILRCTVSKTSKNSFWFHHDRYNQNIKTPSPNYNKHVIIHVLFSAISQLERGAVCRHTFSFYNTFQQNYTPTQRKLNNPFKHSSLLQRQ